MWVGQSYYTIEGFISEAQRLGCCKRINGFPSEIAIGESKCFLAHDTSLRDCECRKCGSQMIEFQELPIQDATLASTDFDAHCLYCDYTDDVKKFRLVRGEGRIFGYYLINGIEAVLKKGMSKKELKEKGVTVVDVVTVGRRPKRGCGYQLSGGFYVVSAGDMDKLREDIATGDFSGTITLIKPPIPLHIKRFRGYKYVNGNKILEHEAEEAWYDLTVIRKKNRKIRKAIKRGFVQKNLGETLGESASGGKKPC